MRSLLARSARTGVGLALGALTAVLDIVVVAVALLLRTPYRGLDAAVSLERRRMARWFGQPTDAVSLPPPRQLRYLAGRIVPGLLGGAIVGLIALGLGYAATLLYAWLTGTTWIGAEDEPITGTVIALYTLPGAVLLFLGCAGCAVVASWERSLLRRADSPTAAELVGRVSELTQAREAVIAAVDDERRRIERDLHDGVQQRLVALGMLLGRAQRRADKHGDHAGAMVLVQQAHEEAQHALSDLRDVSWRVYPAALDQRGLVAALDSVAERAPLPVRIVCDLPGEPPAAPRAVVWFVVCEAVTNAAKHADASEVVVEVSLDVALRASIRDDGHGGADPSGVGLAGLARRAESVDGTLRITSPPGGPTVVEVSLPCAS